MCRSRPGKRTFVFHLKQRQNNEMIKMNELFKEAYRPNYL